MAKVRLDLLISQQAKEWLVTMASEHGCSMSQLVERLITTGFYDGEVTFTDLTHRVADLERQLNNHIMRGRHE